MRDFRLPREMGEIRAPLGYYAAYGGNSLPTYRRTPTRCYGMLNSTYNLLNMFRALICPSSGARDDTCVITAYGVWCLGCWWSAVRCRAAGYASGMTEIVLLSKVARSSMPQLIATACTVRWHALPSTPERFNFAVSWSVSKYSHKMAPHSTLNSPWDELGLSGPAIRKHYPILSSPSDVISRGEPTRQNGEWKEKRNNIAQLMRCSSLTLVVRRC